MVLEATDNLSTILCAMRSGGVRPYAVAGCSITLKKATRVHLCKRFWILG
jgi:hypothetical protein